MTTNSSNNYKTNNHPLPQLIEYIKTTTCNVGNPDHGLEQAQNVAMLKRLMGYQPSLS